MYRKQVSKNDVLDKGQKLPQVTLTSIFIVAFVISVACFCINIGVVSLVAVSAGIYSAAKNSTPLEVAFSIPTPTTSTTYLATATILSPTETLFVPSTSVSTPTSTSELPTVEDTSTSEPEVTATKTPTPTQTSVPTETSTQTATIVPTSTITRTPLPSATMDSTQEAGSMAGIVQQLYDTGILSTTNGDYFRIADYDSNWAQTDSYQKTYSGYEPTNFVIQADATWQVFENTGNWTESGCGIVFHENDQEDHYLVVFSMGGQAFLWRRMSGGFSKLGISYRYEVDHDIAQAKVMIAVEDNWITIFVDNQEVYHFHHPYLESGKLAFTVISGSMIDYGTRCTLSNIELWEIQ